MATGRKKTENRKEKTQITLRLDHEILSKLDMIARRQVRNRSSLINFVLHQFVKAREASS
jgi:predicted transcriptional regulator